MEDVAGQHKANLEPARQPGHHLAGYHPVESACTHTLSGLGQALMGIRPFAPILLECGLDIYQRLPTSTIHQSKGGHHSLVGSRITHATL